MIREDFIDFLTSEETLSKFKTTEKGRKFRKATPLQVAAVILCVLKNKQDGKYYYGDRVNAVMTHRVVHKLLCTPNRYKETDIELCGKDGKLTEDTIYSILRNFNFFDSNKTKERYIFKDGRFYTDDKGKHYNNWRTIEDKLCEFIGWSETIYEEDMKEIKEELKEIHTKVDEINKKIDIVLDFVVDDDEVTTKALEVLKDLRDADDETIDEWLGYFNNVMHSKRMGKGSKLSATAAINAINEYKMNNE